MEILTDGNKRSGVIGTILFHLLLLLLFIFYGLKEPFPPREEIGMPLRIRLGNTEIGSGTKPSLQPGITSENNTRSEAVPENSSSDISTPDVATQPDNPTSVKKDKKKQVEEKVTETTPSENQKTEQTQTEEQVISDHLKNLLDKFKTRNKQGTGGYGTSDNEGSTGHPDGAPDGGDIGGDLPGGGGFSLSGRKVISPVKPKGNRKDEGFIVVEIIVDKNGNVLKASPGVPGTTIINDELWNNAREAAMKMKFTSSPNAPIEQIGKVRFKFTLE